MICFYPYFLSVRKSASFMSLNTIVFDDSGSDGELKIVPPKKPPTRTRIRKTRTKKDVLILEDDKTDPDIPVKEPEPEPKPVEPEKPAEIEEIKEEIPEQSEIQEETQKSEEQETTLDPNRQITEEELHEMTNSIKRINGYPITTGLVPFKFNRHIKLSWKGTKTRFELRRGKEFLFFAKFKKSHRTIPIYTGANFKNPSAVSDAKLMTSQDYDFFRLYTDTSDLAEITISPGKIRNSPRVTTIEFKQSFPDVPMKLTSKKPSISPCGLWSLNINGRYAVKSIKNSIMIDEKNNEFLSLMKTYDNDATVESYYTIPPIIVFSFAIASFLCNVK